MTGVAEMLETLRENRRRVLELLQDVADEQMLVTSKWRDRTVDVRFFFYRLVAHQVEHTVHLSKTLHGLGVAQSEAGLILSNIQAARGELEGMLVGLTDEDLDRVPAEGEWPARKVLEHIMEAEESYTRRIENALEDSKTSD